VVDFDASVTPPGRKDIENSENCQTYLTTWKILRTKLQPIFTVREV
jgi:hypothetical protein